MSNKRSLIIIVDDDADLAQLFTDAIKSAGLGAIGFDNPLHALNYLSEHHSQVCLVVTDWRMPEINGLELTKKVAELDSEIEIILMSAYELDADKLKEINKENYLKKPLRIGQLIETIKKEFFAKDCIDICNDDR
jgi:two-component SAPR family response regulator